ncbi:putative lipoprotein LprB [Mycolicibacter hiberniae]|uniref:Putative lipoprotein LprB n=2 Tax=Mycolicibacter hiberniae TaxID=29314 RepID=A0A7I7WXV1_9MYCO|nr:putative lipoprotein LprB [Mycolicibacter hiberniae]
MHRVRLTLTVPALAAAALIPMLGGCSDADSPEAQSGSQTSSSAPEQGTHGPSFPLCGGVSDETMTNLTRVAGLVSTAQNSVGCQWLLRGGIMGPHFSFSWYRGSPIGRERKTEEVSRTSVEDINIDGHSGFIAIGTAPTMGDNLCEIGIQFKDDFIEWSVSFAQKPFPDPCDVAKELTRQSIANAK